MEKLWTIRDFPVEGPTWKNNLRPMRPEKDDLVPVDAPSPVASLDRAAARRTLSVHLNTWAQPFIVTKNPLGGTSISSKSSASRRIAGVGRWRYIARLVLIDGTTEMVTCECDEQAARFRGAA